MLLLKVIHKFNLLPEKKLIPQPFINNEKCNRIKLYEYVHIFSYYRHSQKYTECYNIDNNICSKNSKNNSNCMSSLFSMRIKRHKDL